MSRTPSIPKRRARDKQRAEGGQRSEGRAVEGAVTVDRARARARTRRRETWCGRAGILEAAAKLETLVLTDAKGEFFADLPQNTALTDLTIGLPEKLDPSAFLHVLRVPNLERLAVAQGGYAPIDRLEAALERVPPRRLRQLIVKSAQRSISAKAKCN